MLLKLQNILKINRADIELGGLTVITGENNTGKSTVGKTLFSLIKTVNALRSGSKHAYQDQIYSKIRGICSLFRRRGLSSPIIDTPIPTASKILNKSLEINDFEHEIKSKASESGFSRRQIALLESTIEEIKSELLKIDSPEAYLKSLFKATIHNEFQEPITSFGKAESEIDFFDDTKVDDGGICLKIVDNDVVDASLRGDISITDITFVESPVYLPILNALRSVTIEASSPLSSVLSSANKEKIPLHITDMAQKILSSDEIEVGLFEEFFYPYKQQTNNIQDLIGGSFNLNGELKELTFNQDNHQIPPLSVATGIKSFGVLQRLLSTNNVSTEKMLVWDEPEIHLHPEWQIVFCRLIVELVSKGVPIVVSTHSPYFVQGLRYYASAYGIENEAKYYMAEDSESEGLFDIVDVTDDLNRVFTLLAAPLQKIMNVDAVRNSLK